MNNQEEEMVQCPTCKGTGEGKEKSIYVRGEFYGDCPVVCDVCSGTGKINIEDLEYYS